MAAMAEPGGEKRRHFGGFGGDAASESTVGSCPLCCPVPAARQRCGRAGLTGPCCATTTSTTCASTDGPHHRRPRCCLSHCARNPGKWPGNGGSPCLKTGCSPHSTSRDGRCRCDSVITSDARIASSNQHPISTGTTQSSTRGACGVAHVGWHIVSTLARRRTRTHAFTQSLSPSQSLPPPSPPPTASARSSPSPLPLNPCAPPTRIT